MIFNVWLQKAVLDLKMFSSSTLNSKQLTALDLFLITFLRGLTKLITLTEGKNVISEARI